MQHMQGYSSICVLLAVDRQHQLFQHSGALRSITRETVNTNGHIAINEARSARAYSPFLFGDVRWWWLSAEGVWSSIPYMAPATLIFRDKLVFPGGFIQEMVIWRLPAADAERPHGLKYSLYFGRDGHRLVVYDNERGKGDHRHYGTSEEKYEFTSVEQLVADFEADVSRVRGI